MLALQLLPLYKNLQHFSSPFLSPQLGCRAAGSRRVMATRCRGRQTSELPPLQFGRTMSRGWSSPQTKRTPGSQCSRPGSALPSCLPAETYSASPTQTSPEPSNLTQSLPLRDVTTATTTARLSVLRLFLGLSFNLSNAQSSKTLCNHVSETICNSIQVFALNKAKKNQQKNPDPSNTHEN